MDQWKSTVEQSVYRLQGVAGTLDLITTNNDITNGIPRVGEMFVSSASIFQELIQKIM